MTSKFLLQFYFALKILTSVLFCPQNSYFSSFLPSKFLIQFYFDLKILTSVLFCPQNSYFSSFLPSKFLLQFYFALKISCLISSILRISHTINKIYIYKIISFHNINISSSIFKPLPSRVPFFVVFLWYSLG